MTAQQTPVIVTADDFGLSEAVNAAVEQAHRDGILSAASLMVAAPAAADAVARARRLPGLRVGLHVALVQATPVLPPAQIAALVDERGRFPDNLAKAGFIWFFSPAARRQLRQEVAAQFAAFRATGLTLDHVNAHNHMHLHPTLLSAILAELRGSPKAAVRLPREPWRASLGPARPGARALLERAVMAPWLAVMRQRLKRAGIAYNDWLLGLAATGHVDETALLHILDTLPGGVAEIYCHPAAGSTPGTAAQAELAALISPVIAKSFASKGLRPCGFADI